MQTPVQAALELPPKSSGPAPGPADIQLQLDRIITSPEFPGVGRCAAFLSYVVREVLAGRANRIKGYSIAIEVFNREEGFTQDDPVVRIEAGRLRRALERYYLIAGQDDPVRIDIAKGGYVPTFTWACSKEETEATQPSDVKTASRRKATSTLGHSGLSRRMLILGALLVLMGLLISSYWIVIRPAGVAIQSAKVGAPDGPTLLIAPFAALSDGPDAKVYALGLTEELLTALPRFKEIRVFGRETSEALLPEDNDPKAWLKLGARFLLTGGVRISGDQIRVTARLMDTTNGMILWSQIYDDDLRTHSLFSIQSDVADKVATTVAQPYGIISQADTHSLPPDDIDAYACTLRFYSYRAELSVEGHASVRDCLESAVARYPAYATAWAMLSMVYLDEHRFKFNRRPGAPPALERSLQAARRAVQLDPENTRGLQALMTALYFNRQPGESLRIGEQALAINPNDTELMGEYGTRLAMSGRWKRGASLLQVALSRNPGGAGYYHGVLGLADYMQGNYEIAADEIRQADLQKFPLFHVVAAVIFAESGMPNEAAREAAKFRQMGAEFLVDLNAELEERIGQPEDRARFLQGMRKAGLQIQDALAANSSPSPSPDILPK